MDEQDDRCLRRQYDALLAPQLATDKVDAAAEQLAQFFPRTEEIAVEGQQGLGVHEDGGRRRRGRRRHCARAHAVGCGK
jgi:hypothetical protein